MPQIKQGEANSATNPILKIFTAVGNPRGLVDVAFLRFKIVDISTPAKLATPVQVYPAGPPGTFFDVDPTTAFPTGVRLGVGQYFAPWPTGLGEPIGDHRIDWEFKPTVISPWIPFSEVFQVTTFYATTYCSVADIRAEGFTNPAKFSDSRIAMLCDLATKYIDKMTGRWFSPRTFSLATPPVGWTAGPVIQLPGMTQPVPTQNNMLAGDNPYRLSGKGRRELELDVPIIRLDFLGIENQAFLFAQLTWIELSSVRYFNRHLAGQTQPDDRENPLVGFTVVGRIVETVASGLYPAPRIFPNGRLNVFLFGVFGYTDWDPSGQNPLGTTPTLIVETAKKLVIRDLLPMADAGGNMNAERLAARNMWRINSDSEGGGGGATTSVGLQDLWVHGGLTGDPDIDTVLMSFRRPPRMAAV